MSELFNEWLRQAEYDLETAEYMFDGGRYFYSVFLCHLAVEKALKGLYQERLAEYPPKIHNLITLLTKAGIKPPEDTGRFIIKINEASVATRYPEDLEKIKKLFPREVTRLIIEQSKAAVSWIKQQQLK